MATVIENIKGNWSSNDFNRPPFLGFFSAADIATINAAIAAGQLGFLPPGSSLRLSASDTTNGKAYTLTGVGTAAAFASVDGGGNSGRTVALMGAVKVVTIGASITNGSSSSNAGSSAYSPRIGSLGNQRKVDGKTVFFGYPGQKAAYIYSQLQTAIDAGPDILILGPDFGTNGASDSALDVISTYADYVLKAWADCKKLGIGFAVCMTLPQGIEQASANTHIGIRAQNTWLATVARKLGINVIDTYTEMCDQATGYLSTAYYNSADPVHPLDAGHLKLASLINAWLDAYLTDIPWPVGTGSLGLVANPTMLGAGPTPDTWSQTISPSTFTGTATRSIVARDNAVDLPIGRWWKTICDASTAGGVLRSGSAAIAVTPGETLLIVGYAKATGTGSCSVAVWSNTTTTIAATLKTLVNDAPSVPFCIRYVVPAGMLSMRIALMQTTSVGQNLASYLGACDVIRPSTVGSN